MKKAYILIFCIMTILLSTSCSSTWDGVKSDSKGAWKSTKKSIHEATK